MRIIDSHSHLMTESFQYLPGFPMDDFLQIMDKASVEVSVIFTLQGLIRDFRENNDRLARAVKEHRDRLVGLGSVNPWYGKEALEEIRRCFEELDFAGLKLHPWYTGFLINSQIIHPICEIAAEFRKPIFVHTGTPPGSAPLQVAHLATLYPETTFVLGHAGLPDLWWEAVTAAARHPNIYLETAGAHSLSIRYGVENVGASKVLFGSDSPFGGRNNLYFQKEKIILLELAQSDTEAVLGLNAARVFNIK